MNNRTLSLMMGAAGASSPAVYVEDVFSTFLYTGNSSTQTITNGIDLSGKGGLVWTKTRNAPDDHYLNDTNRGAGAYIRSNKDNPQVTDQANTFTSFNPSGFTLAGGGALQNALGNTYASWTFRKEPGFFDVVTWTGNYPTEQPRDIAHNLGSTPGCVIIKRTSSTGNWGVWHRSISTGTYAANQTLFLNSTAAAVNYGNVAGPFTSTTIRVGEDLNQAGQTYVAYLFAHDAQLFGDGGNQSVVKCGSYTTDASGYIPEVDLGWEPQFLLYKASSTTGNWEIADTMRRWNVSLGGDGGTYNSLYPNLSNAEVVGANGPVVKSTGFGSPGNFNFGANTTFIYIAIRRGPMKTPTDATKVFDDVTTSGATGTVITTGFPVDWQLCKDSRSGTNGVFSVSRLTGVSTVDSDVNGGFMRTSSTAAETQNNVTRFWDNTGYKIAASQGSNSSIYWNFRRAPGFFDVVAYTGTGSARTVSHNLGVAPELMIVKSRSSVFNWLVYTQPTGNDYFLSLNNNQGINQNTSNWNATTPTSSVFSLGATTNTNGSGSTYIAYLFASCPGVSKVGSYTGTGTTLSIDCGFTAGARFVLIKRTDSIGDWYVWDTARGIIAANDPYLLLNSTAAEVTNTDYIDPLNSGFQISSTAPAEINASGGSFIYLAIA